MQIWNSIGRYSWEKSPFHIQNIQLSGFMRYLAKCQMLNTTGRFLRVIWLTQEKPRRSKNPTTGKGNLCPSFLYLKRAHNLPKLHNFACCCADPGSSDERVSDNNITPLILPSIQPRFLEHLPGPSRLSALLSLKMMVVFQRWPPALPAICLVQKNSIFWSHKLLNLSIAIFLAFPFFVFYNSMKSHLPGLLEQFSWARNLLRKKKLQKGVGGGGAGS